jgi:hypothetical protein
VVNFIILYVALISTPQQAVEQQNFLSDAVLGSIVQVHFSRMIKSQWQGDVIV